MSRVASAKPYTWPYDGSLAADDVALVLIDMQTDFCGLGGYVAQMGYDVSLTRAPIEPLRSVLAAAQEQSGDTAAAEATLQQLRSDSDSGYPADAATMDLARFYERQGRLDEARSLYGELAPAEEPAEDEIPSVYAGQAQARLDELEG